MHYHGTSIINNWVAKCSKYTIDNFQLLIVYLCPYDFTLSWKSHASSHSVWRCTSIISIIDLQSVQTSNQTRTYLKSLPMIWWSETEVQLLEFIFALKIYLWWNSHASKQSIKCGIVLQLSTIDLPSVQTTN